MRSAVTRKNAGSIVRLRLALLPLPLPLLLLWTTSKMTVSRRNQSGLFESDSYRKKAKKLCPRRTCVDLVDDCFNDANVFRIRVRPSRPFVLKFNSRSIEFKYAARRLGNKRCQIERFRRKSARPNRHYENERTK